MIEKLKQRFQLYMEDFIRDDDTRIFRSLSACSAIFFVTSVVMTVTNLFTHLTAMAHATATMAVMFALFFVLFRRKHEHTTWHRLIFALAILLFLNYFLVSGGADGFACLWILLLAPLCFFLLGMKIGLIICIFELLVLIFFLYLPVGQGLLQYQYTEQFMLRFPLLYTAASVTMMFVEYVRLTTYNAMQKAKDHYREMYQHDALTGLYNRYGFDRLLDLAVTDTAATHCVGLLIADIDHFKRINDQFGHPAGDVVLQEVAETLRDFIGARGAVCRWGGEEFAVLLCGDLTADTFQSLLEEVRSLVVSTDIPAGGSALHVTVSIGGALSCSIATRNAALLVNTADNLLYDAKNKGRNRAYSICLDQATLDTVRLVCRSERD